MKIFKMKENYNDDDNSSKHKHSIELEECQCYNAIKESQLKLENIKTYLPKVKPCSTILGCDITTAVEGLWQLLMKMETKTKDIAGMVSNEFHNRDSSGQSVKSPSLIEYSSDENKFPSKENADHYEFISSMVAHHLPLLECSIEFSDFISSSSTHTFLSSIEEDSGLLTSMLVHQLLCTDNVRKDTFTKTEKHIHDELVRVLISGHVSSLVSQQLPFLYEEDCIRYLATNKDIQTEDVDEGETHIDNEALVSVLIETAGDDTCKDDHLKDNNDSDHTNPEHEQYSHISSENNQDITETEYFDDENKADMADCHQTYDEIFEPFDNFLYKDKQISEEFQEYRSRIQRIKELQKLLDDEFDKYRIQKKYRSFPRSECSKEKARNCLEMKENKAICTETSHEKVEEDNGESYDNDDNKIQQTDSSNYLKQCIDLAMQVVNRDMRAYISIKVGNDFSFTFNNQEFENVEPTKTKRSPSLLGKNQETKEEFINKTSKSKEEATKPKLNPSEPDDTKTKEVKQDTIDLLFL